MKRALVFVLLGSALVGCSGVGSVYPICTPYDTVRVAPDVLGTWTDKDKGGLIVISPDPRGIQKLQFREDDGSLNTFDIRLTKIGGELFADLCESGGGKDAPCSMPVHLFAKVEVMKDTLKLYSPDAKWFDAHLSQHSSAIPHIKQYAKGEEGWIYLTGETKQVRSFIKKCAKKPGAFVEFMTLTKVSDSQELPPADTEKTESTEPGK